MHDLWLMRRGLMMAQNTAVVGPGYYYAATEKGVYRSKTPSLPSSWTNVLNDSSGINSIKFANGTGICVRLHAGIYRSTDGETWSNVFSSSTDYLCGVASDGQGNWIIAGYISFSPLLLKSVDDGLSWTDVTSAIGSNEALSNVGYHDGLWIVTERYCNGIYRSSDLSTWVKSTRATASLNEDRNLLSYVNGSWLLWSSGTNDTRAPQTSPDGIDWTDHPNMPTNVCSRAIYRSGLYWIAGGSNESGVLTSPDLSIWTLSTEGISSTADAELCVLGTKDGVFAGGTYGYLNWWNGSTWNVITRQYDVDAIWGRANINELEYW